jgi:hypothetical protein
MIKRKCVWKKGHVMKECNQRKYEIVKEYDRKYDRRCNGKI